MSRDLQASLSIPELIAAAALFQKLPDDSKDAVIKHLQDGMFDKATVARSRTRRDQTPLLSKA